jgi:hypothetical protein
LCADDARQGRSALLDDPMHCVGALESGHRLRPARMLDNTPQVV